MVKMKKVKLDYRCISDHPQQSQSQLIVISTRKLFSIGNFSCLAVLLVLANHIHGINSQGEQSFLLCILLTKLLSDYNLILKKFLEINGNRFGQYDAQLELCAGC